MLFPRSDAALRPTPVPVAEPAARFAPGDGGVRRAWWAFAATRPRRVTGLMLAIIGLSLFDLHLTLTYLQSGGMIESNPLARLVISYGSPKTLAVWKAASVALAVWILWRARARRSAEIAAWIGVAVLVWLALQWSGYSAVAGELIKVASLMDERYLETATGGRWVTLATP